MHRIDGAGHVNNRFVSEDPDTNRPPTEFTAEWFNAFQEELATFIEWAGIILDKEDNTQLKQALLAKFAGLDAAATKAGVQAQAYTAFTTGGEDGAFTLTPVPAIGAYAAGQRFRVKFHAAGTGADVLNVSTLGNKSLKQYDSNGAKVAPVIAASQLADVEYDGVDMVIVDSLPPAVSVKQIQSITASVSANALTVGLNPTSLDFRASPLTSGGVNTRSIPAALSITIPSGATLGTVSGQQARLVLIAIDNAGTVELAVGNLAGGINLDETTLISTTSISGASNNAAAIYSTTSRANVAYRVVGFIDVTEATAGTWATAPSTVQGHGGQACAALQSIGFGQTIQNVSASRAAGTTYYNTTGRPIFVNINFATSATCTLIATVNGTSIFGSNGASAGQTTAVSFIVPPGGSYSASNNAGTSVINCWTELR